MTEKALISELTWRTLEMQREEMPGLPMFTLPDDLSQIFRATTRKQTDCFHVSSLGIIADNEKDFRDFLAQAKKRKAEIFSREDGQLFVVNGNCEHLVKWWKDARRKGSSKIGGERGAAKKKEAIAQRAKGLTKEEWTNGSIKNAKLVEKYDVSINSLKRYASDKGWGHDRQKAIWRAEAAKERKANAKR